MFAYDFDANVNVNINNNQKTINTGDVNVIAGPGSSGIGINC